MRLPADCNWRTIMAKWATLEGFCHHVNLKKRLVHICEEIPRVPVVASVASLFPHVRTCITFSHLFSQIQGRKAAYHVNKKSPLLERATVNVRRHPAGQF